MEYRKCSFCGKKYPSYAVKCPICGLTEEQAEEQKRIWKETQKQVRLKTLRKSLPYTLVALIAVILVIVGGALLKHNSRYGNLDRLLGRAIVTHHYQSIGVLSEGLRPVRHISDGLYGYANDNGMIIVPLIYSGAHPFDHGMGRVEMYKKYGAINHEGTEVIPIIYDTIGKFRRNAAKISKYNKYGLIDSLGTIILPAEYDSIDEFDYPVARIEKENLFGMVDSSGTIVLPIWYDSISDFKDGVAEIVSGDSRGIIDTLGRVIVPVVFSLDEIKSGYRFQETAHKPTYKASLKSDFDMPGGSKSSKVRNSGSSAAASVKTGETATAKVIPVDSSVILGRKTVQTSKWITLTKNMLGSVHTSDNYLYMLLDRKFPFSRIRFRNMRPRNGVSYPDITICEEGQRYSQYRYDPSSLTMFGGFTGQKIITEEYIEFRFTNGSQYYISAYQENFDFSCCQIMK